jgi:hypothetical protein
LPIDILEFFCLTPLPGSEDHQVLWRKGAAMEPDLNRYDVEHVCAEHPRMSRAEWEAIYREAWDLYYTPAHMETLLRRAAATGVHMGSVSRILQIFATSVRLENIHPLQGGLLRLRHPSERRPGMARESAWSFWPRFAWDTLRKHVELAAIILWLRRTRKKIARDPRKAEYMDAALTPVVDDDVSLDLMTQTTGAAAAVAHELKIAGLAGARREAPTLAATG